MPEAERATIFARLVENQEWREDLLDLITISERRGEPVRPIDEVFRDLNECDEDDPALLAALDEASAQARANPGKGFSASEVRAKIARWNSK